MKKYRGELHRVNVKNLFDLKASKWTSKYQHKLYHRINAFISTLKRYCTPGATVLDFGCGSGVLTLKAIESGYNVFGIDISDQMIKECEIMLNENNYPVQLFCGTFDEHKEKFPYVDAIICSSVLEYIAKPEKLLINFHNILNDNGILIITVPNRNSYIRLIENAAKHINFILRKLSCINRIKQYSDYLSLSINRYTMSEFVSLIKKCNFDSIQAFYFSHKIKTEKFNRNASMLFFVLRKR